MAEQRPEYTSSQRGKSSGPPIQKGMAGGSDRSREHMKGTAEGTAAGRVVGYVGGCAVRVGVEARRGEAAKAKSSALLVAGCGSRSSIASRFRYALAPKPGCIYVFRAI